MSKDLFCLVLTCDCSVYHLVTLHFKLQKWQNALKEKEQNGATPSLLGKKIVKPVDVVKRRLKMDDLFCKKAKTSSSEEKRPQEIQVVVDQENDDDDDGFHFQPG